MNEPIISLMDRKIKQLERYNEITEQMIYDDIDTFGSLLEQRQQILTDMDGISMDVKQFISEQSIERQDKINAVMNFRDIGELNGELLELQDKIKAIKQLKDDITVKDKTAFERIKKMRDDLKLEMENTLKSKQVIDYFSQTSIDVNKGSKLNISN